MGGRGGGRLGSKEWSLGTWKNGVLFAETGEMMMRREIGLCRKNRS